MSQTNGLEANLNWIDLNIVKVALRIRELEQELIKLGQLQSSEGFYLKPVSIKIRNIEQTLESNYKVLDILKGASHGDNLKTMYN